MTIDTSALTGADLRRRLIAIVVRVINTARSEGTRIAIPKDVAAHSFPSLGIDSLVGAELTAEIEDELGLELSPSDVFVYPDIESLARLIERQGNGMRSSDDSRWPNDDLTRGRHMRQMLDDAVLPPEIVPRQGVSQGGVALVTGATGFVGAHVLRALLRRSAENVCCLVRFRYDDDRTGLARVREALERYAIWEDAYAARIEVVRGNIARPLLHLGANEFLALSHAVHTIYHSAAEVDWVQSYEGLRDTNVFGTRELLRLACTGTAKPFHFVSSLAVCYTTDWREPGREDDDAINGLAGLHLGYAQSKCVAESLVREAARRGLRATLVRPALVSGDSVSGVSNADDLLSLFVRSCIRMRAAPDLDWPMDSVPVDFVAEALLGVAAKEHAGLRTYHLANAGSRHWRECVLWMRLQGYSLELLSFAQWSARLRVEAVTPDHPLFALRSFFLAIVAGQHGLSLPELYEQSRRRPICSDESRHTLQAIGVSCPPFDARLLDRYFASYVRLGVLPKAGVAAGVRSRVHACNMNGVDRLRDQCERIELDMRERSGNPHVRIVDATLTPMGGDDGIITELTSWRGGTSAGLYRAQLLNANGLDATRTPTDVVIKVKPLDRDVIDTGGHVAHLCSPALGRQYDAWHDHIGLTRGHVRELAVYECAPVRARPFMPQLLATVSDPKREEWILALEHVRDAVVINAWNRPWAASEIEVALEGLAQLHASWFERQADFAGARWLPPARTPELMMEMRPLWLELAKNAQPMFDRFAGSGVTDAHRTLVESIDHWWHPLMEQPRTLIHNDFNPRNILLRKQGGEVRLCAFDWEMATVGAPQRDLAELLCFVLDPETAGDQVHTWITRGRKLLERASDRPIDAGLWAAGFRAAHGELLIDRLSMYAMLHRIRAQAFLPRIVRTWMAIHNGVEVSMR